MRMGYWLSARRSIRRRIARYSYGLTAYYPIKRLNQQTFQVITDSGGCINSFFRVDQERRNQPMSDNRASKLTELPQTNAISNTDLFYVVSNGVSLAVNAAILAAYIKLING